MSTWTPSKAIEYLEAPFQDMSERDMMTYGKQTEDHFVRPLFQILDDDTVHLMVDSARNCAICHWTLVQGGEVIE